MVASDFRRLERRRLAAARQWGVRARRRNCRFNQKVFQLNQRAATRAAGRRPHRVRENHALYLGPVEQRAIALRQFEALLTPPGRDCAHREPGAGR